jgi:gliding motility-associated lipoprotein GldK
MRRVTYLILIYILSSSCLSNQERPLISISAIHFKEAIPFGMVEVRRGAFNMGSPADSTWGVYNDSMTVSIESFWMDEHEVTNYLYKRFVSWVTDSIIRERISEVDPSYKVMNQQTYDSVLNWQKPIVSRKIDPAVRNVINSFYFNDKFQSKRMIRSELINYKFAWIDAEKATQKKYALHRNNLNTDVKQDEEKVITLSLDTSFISARGRIVTKQISRPLKEYKDYYTTSIVNIYPDTNCWKSDFEGEKNDMYLSMYFSSPAYLNYPVVGVSWEQANAFCYWRTRHHRTQSRCDIAAYRLPTEAEWEYASKGGNPSKTKQYPWIDKELTNKKGQFISNFKPRRGDFTADKYLITSPVGSFLPNEFGIYDLMGNVAEWTSTAYFSSGNRIMSTMNPSTEFNTLANTPYKLKQKIVKGGSFKDVYNFVNINLREWKYQNEQLPYVGFRCVRNVLGER